MWSRMAGIGLGGALALGLAAGSVAAGTFASATAEVGAAGELRVTATEVGIRDLQSSAYFRATATATATYGCRNQGGHTPRGYDAEPVFGVVFSPELALTPDANGTATGTMVVPPLTGTAPCPSGLTPALVAVRYERVAVADDTSGAGITLPGAFTRRF
jgi:hypothetical protein